MRSCIQFFSTFSTISLQKWVVVAICYKSQISQNVAWLISNQVVIFRIWDYFKITFCILNIRRYFPIFVTDLFCIVRARLSYLCYLCLFAHSGVQHILCSVFAFGFHRFVYPICWQFLWIIPLFQICPSVFSSLYFIWIKIYLKKTISHKGEQHSITI
jgi:hypothetical protein